MGTTSLRPIPLVSARSLLENAKDAEAESLIYSVKLELSPSFPDMASLFRTLEQKEAFAVFLESAKLQSDIARHSIIAFDPLETLYAKGRVMRHTVNERTIRYTGDPLFFLNARLNRKVYTHETAGFTGGFIGYFGYESHRYTMDVPLPKKRNRSLPDLFLFSPSTVIDYDNQEDEMRINITTQADDEGIGLAEQKLENLLKLIKHHLRLNRANQMSEEENRGGVESSFYDGDYSFTQLPDLKRLHTEESFKKMVEKAREYICAGDIYQVNISQGFEFPLQNDPWEQYLILRNVNPSPFGGYLKLGDIQILSSSPERLIKREGDRIETRPIAGTRPRGKTTETDQSIEEEFLLNDKERAEHIMMIDLERNDLGQVASLGSVKPDKSLFIENYSHVKHLVTNISAELKAGAEWLDVFAALFPGGTITGCPKKRAMEIIAELEGVERGVYTGSFGWVGYNGNMDLNILIRSFLASGGTLSFATGAGIVYDSDPKQEYLETLKKAEALIKALALRQKRIVKE